MNIVFRQELPSDHRRVEELTRDAFWNYFQPGSDEHFLTHKIRGHSDFIPELSLIAEIDNTVVASIVYTKSFITRPDGSVVATVTFGPIAVTPDLQKKGVGKQLILHTAKVAKDMGYPAIIIYGDPAYYARVGFRSGERYDVRTEDDCYAAALQVLLLQPHLANEINGHFTESSAFNEIDFSKLETFDATFLPREKVENTPSQLRFAFMKTLKVPIVVPEL